MRSVSDTAKAGLSLAGAVPVTALAAAAALQLAWNVTGSVAAADWLGVALLAALLVVVVLAAGAAVRPARLAVVSLGLLGAYGAWVALSISWSPLPTLAKEEAQLVLLYALVLAVALLSLRSARERVVALGAVAFAPAVVALGTGVRLVRADDATAFFPDGRLELPIAYANADAALFLLGLWPALVLAAGRAIPVAVRAAALGAASVCLAGWISTQSKGGAVGIVVSAVAVFALAPGRARLAVPATVAAVVAGAAAAPLTEPYRADGNAAAAGVGRALLAVAVLGALVGAVYALGDRRLRLSTRAVTVASRAALALVVALLLAGVVVAVERTGSPAKSVGDAWAAFSEYHPDEGTDGTHLATLGGSNRYDFWRVALAGARDEPLAGIGARGFGALYLREGRSHETPARTHSLLFETLLETGVVGLVLLASSLALAVALVAAAARRRRLHGIAALGGCVGWLAHASVDWTWTFPATGILFFLLLGVGCAGSGALVPRRAAFVSTAAVVVTGAVAFAGPWLSARLTERALASPERAASDLRWARRLDPVSVYPVTAQARTAATSEAALRALEEAARKEPESVATRFLLGITLLELGRADEARAELRAARRLSPRDPIVSAALERAGAPAG